MKLTSCIGAAGRIVATGGSRRSRDKRNRYFRAGVNEKMIFGLGKKREDDKKDGTQGRKDRDKDKDAKEGDTTAKGSGAADATEAVSKRAVREGQVPPLEPAELRRVTDPAAFDFKTTAEIEPMHGPIGQERALRALRFGAGMPAHDYNIFVLGPDASGKSAAVKSLLTELALKANRPDDWVYVHNFESPNAPNALRLSPGRGRRLQKAMTAAIDELQATLPGAFESEDYLARARAIEAEHSGAYEDRLQALTHRSEERGIALLRTPLGFTFAPMLEGKVVKPEAFAAMPPSMQADVRETIEALQQELADILQSLPRIDKEKRDQLRRLNEEVASLAVKSALDDAIAEFGEDPGTMGYLAAVEHDLISNAQLFLTPEDNDDAAIVRQPLDSARDPRFRRYMVNVVVGQDAGNHGAPVVEETNPTHGNLIGKVEHLSQMGALVTDFLLIKPGALHRANGGYLLIDARKLLLSPFAWEAMKRALKNQSVRFEAPAENLGIGVATQSLDPEPIPLSVKVVLFGDRELYYLLAQGDPEFQQLFKVQADFDETIDRTDENTRDYTRLLAGIVDKHGLKALDAGAAAHLVEQASRIAGDRDKLSIEVSRVADLVREADFWAQDAGRETMKREDVRRAVDEHIQRADRLRDRAQETFERGIVMVDTEGEKAGQINGLSVQQLGDFAFGRPTRITARVRFGPGRVVDIEREVKLGGPLHSKGVMILWGYLAGMFAQSRPLALSASLVFEQSYGGVDGDSASSTELYALLSALADAPIRQGLAVTGSVNQLGDVQAIGGVNEKIEGFFDVCHARGLTGQQGVIIPQSNVQHLMLREDVVEAARQDKFHVYAVRTVAEGIELLTGVPAGERGSDGKYPPDSLFGRVEAKLEVFADRAQAAGGAIGGASIARDNSAATGGSA